MCCLSCVRRLRFSPLVDFSVLSNNSTLILASLPVKVSFGELDTVLGCERVLLFISNCNGARLCRSPRSHGRKIIFGKQKSQHCRIVPGTKGLWISGMIAV